MDKRYVTGVDKVSCPYLDENLMLASSNVEKTPQECCLLRAWSRMIYKHKEGFTPRNRVIDWVVSLNFQSTRNLMIFEINF